MNKTYLRGDMYYAPYAPAYLHHQSDSLVGRSENSSIFGRPQEQQDYHGHLCKGKIQQARSTGGASEQRICSMGCRWPERSTIE